MTTRTALTLCIAMLCLHCGAPPPQPSATAQIKAPTVATSSAREMPSAESAPQPSNPPPPVVEGPVWRALESTPTPFAIDGKVDEWQSVGAVQKGWMVIQKDRVVIAGVAPAGASSVEIALSFGPAEPPEPRILQSGGAIDPRGCGSYPGDPLCPKALADQEIAIKTLFEMTQSTYVIRDNKVTRNGNDAVLSKAVMAKNGSTVSFELEIPLAELPALVSPTLNHARVRLTAGGDTQPTKFDELKWKTKVRVGDDINIIADAVLSALVEDNETLFAVLDSSGKEPMLRSAHTSAEVFSAQSAEMATEPLSATKVAAKTRDMELLRYEIIGSEGVATRKNGKIIEAWAIPGARATLRRPVVRDDVIDIAYDMASGLNGVPTDIRSVLVAVARAEASGHIIPVFAGDSFSLTSATSKPFADNNLARFGVRGQRWTGSGFASLSFVWRYDPKSRQYEEVEGKLE